MPTVPGGLPPVIVGTPHVALIDIHDEPGERRPVPDQLSDGGGFLLSEPMVELKYHRIILAAVNARVIREVLHDPLHELPGLPLPVPPDSLALVRPLPGDPVVLLEAHAALSLEPVRPRAVWAELSGVQIALAFGTPFCPVAHHSAHLGTTKGHREGDPDAQDSELNLDYDSGTGGALLRWSVSNYLLLYVGADGLYLFNKTSGLLDNSTLGTISSGQRLTVRAIGGTAAATVTVYVDGSLRGTTTSGDWPADTIPDAGSSTAWATQYNESAARQYRERASDADSLRIP